MRCQDVRRELSAYLGGELIDAEAQNMKEHLLICPSCSRELVAVQALEKDLKAGFEKIDSPTWKLGPWVIRQAAALSGKERARRREWVAGLSTGQAHASHSRGGPGKRFLGKFAFRAVTLAAVLTLLLFVFWPQVVRVSAQVPTVGDWVRMKVYKDAGIAWAYEHGYVSEHPVSASRNGVTLTILGIVADPVQTTVIYLLEGTDESPLIDIKTVGGGLIAYSWFSQQVKTPLGIVGMVHFDPLPEGEQHLKIETKQFGFAMDLTVSREPVSRVAREHELDFVQTVGKAKLRVSRLIYTPAQVRAEFYITSSASTWVYDVYPIPDMFLVDGRGNRIPVERRWLKISGKEYKGYVEFNRPQDDRNLSLLIGDWNILESAQIAFTREDVGKGLTVAGTDLTLISWERNGPVWGSEEILELQIKGDERIQDLIKLKADNFTPTILKERYNGNIAVGFKTDRDPLIITADFAYFFIPGNWEIPLPAVE